MQTFFIRLVISCFLGYFFIQETWAQDAPLLVNAPEKWSSTLVQPLSNGYVVVSHLQEGGWACSRIDAKGNAYYSGKLPIPTANSLDFSPNCLLVINEHEWLVGGTLTGTSTQAILLKMNERFETVWTQTWGETESRTLEEVILTTDEKLVFCGNLQGRPNKGMEVWIAQTDLDGKMIWEKFYGWEKTELATTLIERKDGNFLIGGSTFSKGAGKRDMMLLQTDKEGKLMWMRVYGKDLSNEGIEDLIETPKEEIVIVGWTDENTGNVEPDGRVIFTDKEGKIMWSNILGGTNEDRFLSVSLANDWVYVGGTTVPLGERDPKGWLVAFDQNGKTQEIRTDKSLFQLYFVTGEQLFASSENALRIADVKVKEVEEAQLVSFVEQKTMASIASTETESSPITDSETAPTQVAAVEMEEDVAPPPPLPEEPAPVTAEVASQPEIPIIKTEEEQPIPPTIASEIEPTPTPPPSTDSLKEEMVSKEITPSIESMNLYVISVGVSETKKGSKSVPTADKDAEAFSDFWAATSRHGFQKITPRLFTEQTATGSAVKAHLLDLQTQTTEKDWICLYLNAGCKLNSDGKYYLQLYDTDEGRVGSMISVTAFINMLQLISGKKWIMLDIFHTPAELELEQRQNLLSELTEYLDDISLTLAAMPTETTVPNSEKGLSVFMDLLLEGMRGRADLDKNRLLNLSEISDYIENVVPTATQDQQHPIFIESSDTNFLQLQKNP